MLAHASGIVRFAAAAVAPLLLLVAFAVARPALAGVGVPPAPTLGVDDAPFTRNQVVVLTVSGGTYASPATEWWASNDPATTNGQLDNRVLVPTGVGQWTLAAGAEGPRTIYAQTHHADGAWSAVGSITLTLDTDPGSRVVFDLEAAPQLTSSLPDPVDWHTAWSTPTDRIVGQATTFTGGQSLSITAGTWGVTLASNVGPISVGTHTIPAPGAGGACGTKCAAVTRASAGTCRGSGTFTVTSIAITPDDDLDSLDADYRLVCGTAVLAGSIRYGDASDISTLDQTAFSVALGDEDIGSTSGTQAVTFTNTGDVSNTLGTAAITGGAAGDFEIFSDACSGVTLGVGDSCAVSVRFSPTARGHRFANLAIPDTTPRLARSVQIGGDGWQPVTLALETISMPDWGPAEATMKVTAFDVDTDVTGPGLLIDDAAPAVVSQTSQVLTGPLRSTFTIVFSIGPGHHELTGVFDGRPASFYRAADPVSDEVDVGTSATLELTTTTDDGVAAGESADLIARLTTGGPVTGTLRIREGTVGPIIATTAVSGDDPTLTESVTEPLGTHAYTAEFIPSSEDFQAATDAFDLDVVAGPRPETAMPSSTLHTWAPWALTTFSSPDAGVTFECRYDLSNWFACASQLVLTQNNFATYTFTVRARFANGLADRTPSSRTWIVEDGYTGSTTVDGGATFSPDTTVSVSTAAPAGAPSVTHVGLSNDGTTWTTRTYAATQSWALVSGNGTRTVYTRWRDGNGTWSDPATDTIVLDTKAPTATAPAAAFVTNSLLAGGPIPVKLTWTGADNQSGVAKYTVSRSTDGGAWSTGTTVTAPAATLTQNLTNGHTYRFRVRATDKVGHVGAWVYGATFRVTGYQQNVAAAVYSGSWTTFASTPSTSYWGGSAKASSSAGSRVKFTFTGKAFAWLTAIGPARGKASIYVNGVLQGTVDLLSATSKTKVVGWSKTWATSATRTVEIRVLGTPGRPRVDVDGFWTLR